MKKLLYLFLLVPFCASAQLDESDTLKFKADLDVSGFYQEGNVETLIFRAKSNISYNIWKKWVFKTTNSYVYQEFGKDKADEDVLSLNFLYFNPKRRFYPLVLAFVSTNFRRKIELRSLMGAGVSYNFLNEKNKWLKATLSTEYEQTNFNTSIFNKSEYDGNVSINTMRATLWIGGKYSLFDKKVIFTHESYFQPSLDRSNNYRWRSDLGLEFPIWKALDFKINYLSTFESIVVEDQKEDDRFITVGFKLKSY